jgi:hypothetical protein
MPPAQSIPTPLAVPVAAFPAREGLANATAAPGRDVALDLVRGLAMVILVINHIHLNSALEHVTATFISAAEILVAVSGVVVGMVFGRRWRTEGPRVATAALLRRARKLYLASLAVVALVGALTLVPGLATETLTASPRNPTQDLYAFDGAGRTLLAVVTLEAGPWQFNILGLFIALLAAAPVAFWALDRGWWAPLVAGSLTLFAVGRAWPVDVLPSQSERPFPDLVWQALFVHALVIGWHRERIAAAVCRHRGLITKVVLALAVVATYIQLQRQGVDPLGLDTTLGLSHDDWDRFDTTYFDKTTLDPVRIAVMLSVAGGVYLLAQTFAGAAHRALGWLLLPLGRNSFYVFIVHVFVCLAAASVPALSGDGLGLLGNTMVQVACLALLVVMVRGRILFGLIPR